jgi:type I restriction-modification system DNA methylase subunit
MHPLLNLGVKFPPEAYNYGKRSSGETHGVVLTKPHIVNLILDLTGYTVNRDLAALRLLEPSCGTGAFLLPAVRRLVQSARRHRRKPSQLAGCIQAFDIDASHVEATRRAVEAALNEEGIGNGAAKSLAEGWIKEDDFLLTSLGDEGFDAVVGNPPYIRIEQLSPEIQSEYRRRY